MKRVLGLLLMVAMASVAWGYGYIFNYVNYLPIKWPAGTIPMKIMADNSTPQSDGLTKAASIQMAMQDPLRGWNASLAAVQFTSQIVPPGSGGSDHNQSNEIFFSNSVYGQSWDSNTQAVTTLWYTDNRRTEADIIFNANLVWDSYRGASRVTGPSGPYDLQRVALRELGHVLGLENIDLYGQYGVSALMRSSIGDLDSLQTDDIQGSQSLYGAPGAVPQNDNWANPTAVELSNNSAQFLASSIGGTKEAGEPSHAGDAGGHSVWWYWTAPANGALSVVTNGSNFNTTLAVYTGPSVSALTSVASNDDAPNDGLFSGVNFYVTSGTTYYIAVDGKGGDSGIVELSLGFFQPAVPTISYQPSSQVIEAGQSAYFSVYSNGQPYPYHQWQRLPAGSGVWTNLADNSTCQGSTTNSLTIGVGLEPMNGDQFRCIVTNLAGSLTSSTALLTVNPAVTPQISGLPATANVNYGENLNLYPSLTGTQPMTFQWMKDGVALSDGTYSNYASIGVTTADAGQYTLTATNLAGTVTSAAVTVTVNPPVAPAISNWPATVTLSYGQNSNFYPSITGTQPMTFQWKKDGVAVPDGTTSYYNKYYMTTADSGQYTLTSTNLVGSVTSSVSTVTVDAAVAPVITNIPATATINYGENISLYPSISGTQPMTYQWKKNGVAIPSATNYSYYKNGVTTDDSGQYTLTATNVAGLATSSNCAVTVNAAVAPAITNLPATATINYGEYLSLYPSVSGTQPITYQWKKDGVVIAGATYSNFSKSGVTTADSGVYTLTATNLVGAVTSSDCTVTINAAVAPVISNLPATATTNYGEYLNLYPSVSGTQPISYQWKKDGVAIAGATYYSFSKSGITTADSGVYTLTATNLVGAVTSSNCTVTVNAAVAPVITNLPATATINYGEYLNLYPSVSGTQPISYQWKKDGFAIAGATYFAFSKSPVTTADSGVYTLTATNLVGAVTSSNCTVAVNAAVAPVITNLPATATISYGEYLNLYPSVSGTQPMTFQWKKDEVAIAGATYSNFSKSGVTTADSGVYTLMATNLVGAVTSSNCTVTVNAAVAPVITNLPATATVNYGEYLSLYASVSGTQPMIFQWKKDGVAIAGANYSNYSKSGVTTADSGQYTLTVTNVVATVVSSPVVLTVNAVVSPTITQQPLAVSVAKSNQVSFGVSANGSPSLRYQWYKNEQIIANATNSYFSIASVVPSDGGVYTVKVTNDGGTVTSAPAELAVLPAEIAKITSWPGQANLSANYPYLYFYPNVSGTIPMAFQWYKDEVAIPGATSLSYSNSSATAANAGVYHLKISNEAGIALSPDAVVTWTNGSESKPWLDATQLGSIVYFLAVSPGRIMRYDLIQENWLPVVYLPEAKVPTAFLPTTEGIFIAYNRDLVRRPVDLQTEVETPVATSSATIKMLFAYGSLLYFESVNNAVTYNRSTLSAGPVLALPYPWLNNSGGFTRAARPVFLSTAAKGFTTRPSHSPDDIIQFPIAPDGTIPSCTDSPYHGDFRIGTRQYLTPDEQGLIDNSGVVYKTTDLTYLASLGRPFDDLVFLADGTPVVLRGQTLTAHSGAAFAETGQFELATPHFAIFGQGAAVFGFSTSASNLGIPGVTKVLQSAMVAAPARTPGNPVNLLLSVEDAFITADEVIHFLSRTEQGIVRWDATTRSFLSTLPLRRRPALASYAPAVDRLVLTYGDGALTDLFPGSATTEQVFGYVPSSSASLAAIAVDDLTYLNLSAYFRILLGPLGELKSLSGSSYSGTALAWQSGPRRLYSISATGYNNAVEYIDIPSNGILPVGTAVSANDIVPPLRFSADGSLVLSGNRRVLNADLQSVATLENTVTDGVWLPNHLLTIRARPNGTELQKWARIVYGKVGSVTVPGAPLRIFQLDNSTVVVVTMVNGYLAFSVVAADLTVISYSVNAATIPGAPAITTQPASQSVFAGSAATFGAGASGTPVPTYQWQKNGVNISGATSSSLTIPAVWLGEVGDYSVVATNSAGVAMSNKATLTISTTETGAVPAGFDAAGYLTRYPEVAAVFGSNHYAAWLYYRNHGIYQGEVFDELFRVNEYLALYPELAAIFGSDLGGALEHWLTQGRIEGRLGRLPLEFNAQGYFDRNPDVAAAVGGNALLAWQHYWLYGIYEGRAYDDDLRVFEYLAINADLTAAFVNDWRAAALHWMRYGRTEGRLGRIPLIFSSTDYLSRYPEVGAAWGTYPTTVWLHFWLYGIDEGRTFDEVFRVDEYLALNPDLAAVFGTNRRGAFTHWVRYGQAEGRAGRLP